jgi:hypothetical protein
MPQSEAPAWWADVQDVRETIERRRAAEQAAEGARPRSGGVATAGHGRPRPARHRRPEQASPRRSATVTAAVEGVPGRRRRRPEARRPLHLPSEPAPAGRRTVEITGRPVATAPVRAMRISGPDAPVADLPQRAARGASRRPSPSPAERLAHRPDRIAAWAAVLGFAMMVVAAV